MKYQGSIKSRLTSIILLVTILTSMVSYSSFLFWYMDEQYENTLEKSRIAALVLGQDIAKLTLLNDLSAAADISTKLKSFVHLDRMVLYTLDKKPIYQYSKDNKNFEVEQIDNLDNKIMISFDTLKLFMDASYQGTSLGYISVKFNIKSIIDVALENIYMAILILAVMFSVSYFLSVYYAKKFTQPILGLVKFLEKIEVTDSLKHRAQTNEKNEYGKLYDEVNTMLERMQSSQEALKIAAVAFETQSGMMITDKDTKILSINKMFTKITGYEHEDVIGLNPSILKSGIHNEDFYREMFISLKKYNYWSGEIKNLKKSGDILTEHLIIQTVLDENAQIAYYVASFVDLTAQKEVEEILKEKENLLIHQSKMAAMGEMIGNIAHQWRQPLSVITTISTGMMLAKEMNIKDDKEDQIQQLNSINDNAQYLSQTIDDFRNFFKPNKDIKEFNLKESYEKTFRLISAKFKNLEIDIIENLQDINVLGLENELMQVIMNLMNNAKDALDTNDNRRKLIFVDILDDDKRVYFNITDNAGGVPENIIDRIFEPYFTTKHKADGTGIGLYMSLELVSKHMNGDLEVKNKTYCYEDKEYKGACFSIKIPKIQN